MVSFLVCSLILFLILLHKAYASLLQPFLLYCTLATWLSEATSTMQIEHLMKYTGQRQFCVTLAFFDGWSGFTFIAMALEITVLLTYRVYESLQRQLFDCNLWSKCSKVSMEVIAVSLSVLIPLALSVVFLARGAYGLSGAWCWVSALNSECKGRGLLSDTILGAILYIVPGIVIGVCVVYICHHSFLYISLSVFKQLPT